MSHRDELKQRIINYQRRLQVLEEKRALKGVDVEPHVVLEIEDIEAEIEALKTELTEMGKVYQEAPAVPPPPPSSHQATSAPPYRPPTSRPQPAQPAGGINWGIWALVGIGVLVIFIMVLAGLWFALQGQETPAGTRVADLIPLDTPSPVPTLTPTPTAKSANNEPWLGEVTFALGYDDGKLEPIDPTTCFPEGTTEIHAIFEYNGMENGISWERALYLDGEEAFRKPLSWNQGQSGIFDYFIEAGGNPLPTGHWLLKLYVNGNLIKEGSFRIADGC